MTGLPESMKTWRVTAAEAGMRLLTFLREKNPQASSMKSIKRAIDTKCCMVNGQIETYSTRCLKKNDVVALEVESAPPKLSLPILYEDKDLLIVNKPVGLVCENASIAPLIQGKASLVHRLDKETSGVLILAKNQSMNEQMIALFREKGVYKAYLALVDGEVLQPEGKIDKPLRSKKQLQGQALVEVNARGQSALTLWKRLSTGHKASLLLCEPVTGRTHQLRVHLQTIGHPILGDTFYGKRFQCSYRSRRYLLHSYIISFIHPLNQVEIKVQAPLPSDFIQALTTLQHPSL